MSLTSVKIERMYLEGIHVLAKLDQILSTLADIKANLKELQEYKSLEPAYKFINSEIEVIEMKYERFKESRTKFDQEVEAWTQKQSQPAKSQGNADPSPS